MFFESRHAPPPVPAPWAPVAAAFQRGAAREALRLARPLGAPSDPAAALLLGDVLRAAGDEEGFHAAIRAAAPRFRRDLRLQVQRARVDLIEGRLLAGLRRIDGLTLVARGPWLLLLDALRAATLAQMGRTAAAHHAIERLRAAGALAEPLRAYEVAWAHTQLREWEEAARLLRAVVAACPRWSRPRLHLYDALRSLGRLDEARATLEAALAAFPDDRTVALAGLSALHGRRDWPALAAAARSCAEATPGGDSDELRAEGRALLGLEARSLWRAGARAEATARARALDPAWAERLERAAAGARAARVDVAPIVQDRNMCVAASVAMALRAAGREADPRELFREMASTTRGVTSAELDRWLRARGLEPVDVALTLDAVRAAIDRGLPLLATRAAVLMSHMELVVGYDDGLEELEVIDPAHGLPVFVPYPLLGERWGQAGEALAVVARAGGARDLPAVAVDRGAAARREVDRALEAGNLDAARRLADALPADDWRTARLLVGHADRLLPDDRRAELLVGLAKDEGADVQTRLGVALSLLGTQHGVVGDQTLDALRARMSPFFRGLLRLHRAAARGRWPRARRCAELLLERAAGVDALWHTYSNALDACGRTGDAEAARAICLELCPDHVGANLAALRRPPRSLEALKARRATLDRLLEAHPDAAELRTALAQTTFDLGEPLEAERLLRSGLERAPHSIVVRQGLRRFYLLQARPDLADAAGPPLRAGGLPDALETPALLALVREEAARGERGPASEELDAREAAGRLEPHDALDVVALRLTRRLAQGDAGVDEVRALLPAELPAPRGVSLARLVDPLPPMPAAVAAALHAWALTAMAGEDWSPDARFACAWLDEQAGRTARAAKVYQELGHAEAAHRQGLIARAQGSLREALAHLERAVQLLPAHLASWDALASASAALEERAAEERARRRLVELAPYHPGAARDLLLHLEPGAARRWFGEHGGRYPTSTHQWWSARQALEARRHTAALDAIGPELRRDLPREAFVLELSALEGAGRAGERRARLDAALAEFPEDPWFNHVAAGLETDEALARARYRRLFLVAPHPALAVEIARRCKDQDVAQVLAEAVLAATPAARPAALAAAGEVLEGLSDLRPAVELVERIERARPDDPAVLLRLVHVYGLAGLEAHAAPFVERLLAESPDHAPTLWACGLAQLRGRPLKALEAFERHHRLTRDPDAVLNMARCEHRLGRREAARGRYWKSVELHGDDGDPLSLANLVRLGERPDVLHAPLVRAFRTRPPTAIPEVARAAVLAALAAREPLPPVWAAWATVRLDVLGRGAPSRAGEGPELEDMLRAWADATRDAALLARVGGPPGLLERLMKRKVAWWADRSWVAVAVPA